jgi:hypothetical protein
MRWRSGVIIKPQQRAFDFRTLTLKISFASRALIFRFRNAIQTAPTIVAP